MREHQNLQGFWASCRVYLVQYVARADVKACAGRKMDQAISGYRRFLKGGDYTYAITGDMAPSQRDVVLGVLV